MWENWTHLYAIPVQPTLEDLDNKVVLDKEDVYGEKLDPNVHYFILFYIILFYFIIIFLMYTILNWNRTFTNIGAPGWLSGWASPFGSGHNSGVWGLSPTSGSLQGACFSLCLCLYLTLCVFHE